MKIAPSNSRLPLYKYASVGVLVSLAIFLMHGGGYSQSQSSNPATAEPFAQTAMDIVVAGLRQEIVANATAYTVSGVTIYNPTAPTNTAPQRLLPSLISRTDTNFSNLQRGSFVEVDPDASTNSTATPAPNGRIVGMDRWNAPMLLGGRGFMADEQLPNWIYLNRDGKATATASTDVLGRYAYTIYDEGGLLDVNVAGYPSSVTGTNLSILKGTLAGADLSQIPGIGFANMDTFVKWRNTNSATSATEYVASVSAAATNGFLTPLPGDRSLLSRQDLIALTRSGTLGLTTDALPYLTTFTRTFKAPSWGPTTPLGSSFDYASVANNSTSAPFC